MKKYCPRCLLLVLAFLTASAFGSVTVTQPANGITTTSPVTYKATATTSTCSKGVASMGIYVDNNLIYVVNGASLDTSVSLASGSENTVVQEWDYCGGSTYTPINLTISGSGGGGSTLASLQNSKGWVSYGELPPNYSICTNCGPGVTYWMKQGISSPSLDGKAAEFELGGTTPYSDVLFTNPLIGTNSSQGLPDTNHTLIPSLHNFTYDAYFYTSDLSVAQVLEFDISMYFDSLSLIFGHQCNMLGGHVWDIWDNANSKWVSTGISCYPNNNAWNHVTLQVERTSSNQLLYKSITFNGVTHTLNWYYSPGSSPASWWGITVNYQMDGNSKQSSYTTYMDEFSFTYW